MQEKISKYYPLHLHSNASTLDGLASPEDIAKRIVKLGLDGCALTDHATLAGVPSFFNAMADACGCCGNTKASHENGSGKCLIKDEKCDKYTKNTLKAIAGCEFNVSKEDATIKTPENRKYSHLCILAKNKEGWKGLLGAVSESNNPDLFYYKPRIDIERLAKYAKNNFIAFTGHPGSTIADICFTDAKAAYRSKSYEEARQYVKDWKILKGELIEFINDYERKFGKGNVFLEVQLLDKENMPIVEILGKIMRAISKETGVKCIATPDAHYAFPEDAPDQRVLLCMSLNVKMATVQQQIDNNEDVTLGGFFKSNKYYIPSFEELSSLNTPEELANTNTIADMCEPFKLNSNPRLPKFEIPKDFKDEKEYMRHLCQIGWNKKISNNVKDEDVYKERLEYELKTMDDLLDKYKLSLHTYFLIVADIVRFSVEKLGCFVTPGRGSAAGTLVGYLLDIHDTDPIENKLLFERFFNAGRISETKLALPDIDLDFPVNMRERVIDYMENKYGKDRVAQIATCLTLQGREALTRVLSVHDWGDYKERKFLTSFIPQEAEISDKLQDMMEHTGESSIIKWALINHPDDFKDYCTINENGEFDGPLANYFAQAIRLEGCKRGRGKHASGVVISDVPLSDICPLVYDDNNEKLLAALEFTDLEKMGVLKVDILGVNIWDKIIISIGAIETGEINGY